MKFLASRRWRIFVITWFIYSVHFATNVVREHYPAFSIAEHGTFRVDEYQGFHSDIFVHTDGHAVIGNQVFVSVLAAVPLFIFDPVLDALEDYSKARIAREGIGSTEYRIDKPNRVNFFRLVKERGLDLRFGAATFITTAFFMAPITAGFLVFFYGVMRARGVTDPHATILTFLLGFGTPVFFRTSTLNHNLFVMYAMFIAFVYLWQPEDKAPTLARRLLAGFFGGVALATDYVGVIILPLLWGYFVVKRRMSASWATTLRESGALVAGSLPPIAFLLFSQWAMYGNPFLPGQYWMPDQNVYVHEGLRGWTLPDPELFVRSLFDPSFGMYSWGPLLVLALMPSRWFEQPTLAFPQLERRWFAVAWVAFLLFTSANQYSRLQFNSGFRYLIPLVPFMMLAIADVWRRIGTNWRWIVALVAVAHSWVLTVYREPIWRSWQMLFEEGPQLPWYRVLGLTASAESPWLGTWWVPTGLITASLFVAAVLWRHGTRLERNR